jgi:hypothetical protein
MDKSVLAEDFAKLRSTLNNTSLDFLRTDLDSALMLTPSASPAEIGSEGKERNTRNARHAYDLI